jgi:hypothetical protein
LPILNHMVQYTRYGAAVKGRPSPGCVFDIGTVACFSDSGKWRCIQWSPAGTQAS